MQMFNYGISFVFFFGGGVVCVCVFSLHDFLVVNYITMNAVLRTFFVTSLILVGRQSLGILHIKCFAMEGASNFQTKGQLPFSNKII